MARISDPTSVAAVDDGELLRRYVKARDGAAITELVSRYAPIVYAAARRRTPDPGLAEDICQCAFVTFARRAGSIRSGAVLGAWLLRTTRHCAANIMKTETRRRRHEEAAAQNRPAFQPNSDPAEIAASADEERRWAAIRPALDEAILRLGWADQAVIVLRFLRGLSLGQVATATGTTEEAARKRLSRALERLRKVLAAAGISSSAIAGVDLAAMLAGRAVEVPPGQVLARAELSASKITPHWIHFGGPLMTLIKVAAAALLVAGGSALFRLLAVSNVTQAAPATEPANPRAAADWHARFNEVYLLRGAEFIKNVAPPFIVERERFFQEINPAAAAANAGNEHNQFMIEQAANGRFRLRGYGQVSSSSGGQPVRVIIGRLTRLEPGQIRDDSGFFATGVSGDWVVRAGATPDQIIRGLARIIGDRLGAPIVVTRSFVDRDVVAVSGRRPAGKDGQPTTVQVVLPGGTAGSSHEGGFMPGFRILSQATGYDFVDETSNAGRGAIYNFEISGTKTGDKLDDAALNDVLKSLAEQTGLKFQRTTRAMNIWTLRAAPATQPAPAADGP
jgi:RNA polymerase sigma factor (sigma-70 family)